MGASETRRSANDKRVAEDIAKYGCHVVSVFDPEERTPDFSYSVGIQATTGRPEALVVGVRSSLGHSMINYYNELVRGVAKLKRGILYPGFIDGFSIFIEPTLSGRHSEYTLGCDRYYKGEGYAAVQLIYPTTKGVWPWQKAASEWFKTHQPMLGRKRPDTA